MKRFNLVLNDEIYEAIKEVSGKKYLSVTDVIRQYVLSGLDSEDLMKKRKIRIKDKNGSSLFVVNKIVSWNTAHKKYLYVHANSQTFEFVFSDFQSLNDEVKKLEAVFK